MSVRPSNTMSQNNKENTQPTSESNENTVLQATGEIVNQWIELGSDAVLWTHQYVDADAAFSAALMLILNPDAQLEFHSSDEIADESNVLAVDMMNGSYAVKGLKTGSAFGALVKVLHENEERHVMAKALRPWANQLNQTDSGKRVKDRVVLADLVTNWRAVGLDDREMVKRALELVLGRVITANKREKNRLLSKEIPINGKVAIIKGEDGYNVRELMNRGALILVHESKHGHCVRLTSKAQSLGLNLTEVSNKFPKNWFAHEAGFMLAFGTKKAPKDYMQSGINLKNIVSIMNQYVSQAVEA